MKQCTFKHSILLTIAYILTIIVLGLAAVCISLAMSNVFPQTPHLALDPPTILDSTEPWWTPEMSNQPPLLIDHMQRSRS